jgi:magnesium-protoporphyrin IX monomethyl ester (oxidative) cyclase
MKRYQKILLLNPPGKIYVRPDGTVGERKHCVPPLGLAYLAASLNEAGYEVDVLDILAEGYMNERYEEPFMIYGLPLEETLRRVAESAPDVIGISVLFSNRGGEAIRIAMAIKEMMPEVKIVFGGQHPTSMPVSIMEPDCTDFVICGEADHLIVELMDALNGEGDFDSIKGLYYKRDGEIINAMADVKPVVEGDGWQYFGRKDAPIPQKLDELPFPLWDKFPMESYWTAEVRVGGGDIMRDRFAVMMSTRGCPHTCYFCTSPLLSGWKAYRRRTNDDVVQEIRWLVDTYGIREIQFLDDNFFVSAPRCKKLCVQLKEEFGGEDIIFSVPAGTEVNALDDELIDLMAEANFHKVTLAVEAGDQDVQNELIDKKVDVGRLPALVNRIREKGMTCHALFMIGFPNERMEQIQKTVDLAKSIDVDDFYISVVTPLPGTPLFDQCIEEGIMVEDFDVNNLRYSYSNIKLPDATNDMIERIRRETWVEMKEQRKRHLGTLQKGATREFDSYKEYETAGFAVKPEDMVKDSSASAAE